MPAESQPESDTKLAEDGAGSQNRTWFGLQRRGITIAGVLTALGIIGLAVGLGVGLSKRGSSNDNSNDDSNTPSSTNGTTNTTLNSTVWTPAAGTTWQIVLRKYRALRMKSLK
jgi:hypothetical protein